MHDLLKKANRVFGIINVIGSIIGAISCWTKELIGIGFLVLLGGLAYSFLFYVILGTIAETGENVDASREEAKKQTALLETIEKGLKLQNGSSVLEQYNYSPSSQTSSSAPQESTSDSEDVHTHEEENITNSGIVMLKTGPKPDTIICPRCGQVQRADRSICWNCSAPFIE